MVSECTCPCTGASGFTVASFVLGICCVSYSMAVLSLKGLGKRQGEDALELEGSLYGRKSLDGGDISIGGGKGMQQRHFREYSCSDEDSAVF